LNYRTNNNRSGSAKVATTRTGNRQERTVPLWPSVMTTNGSTESTRPSIANDKRNRQCLRSHRYDTRSTGVYAKKRNDERPWESAGVRNEQEQQEVRLKPAPPQEWKRYCSHHRKRTRYRQCHCGHRDDTTKEPRDQDAGPRRHKEQEWQCYCSHHRKRKQARVIRVLVRQC
jgi:hypothetical protein